jgi:hypothetical protein
MTCMAISRNSIGAYGAGRKKAAYSLDPFEMVREFGARVFAIAKTYNAE